MLLSESPRLPFQPQRKGHPTHRHEADISHDCFPFEKFSRLLIIRLQVCLFKGQHAAASCVARVGGGGREERVRRGKGGRKEGINDDGWKALLPVLQELSQAGKGAFFTFFVWNNCFHFFTLYCYCCSSDNVTWFCLEGFLDPLSTDAMLRNHCWGAHRKYL